MPIQIRSARAYNVAYIHSTIMIVHCMYHTMHAWCEKQTVCQSLIVQGRPLESFLAINFIQLTTGLCTTSGANTCSLQEFAKVIDVYSPGLVWYRIQRPSSPIVQGLSLKEGSIAGSIEKSARWRWMRKRREYVSQPLVT